MTPPPSQQSPSVHVSEAAGVTIPTDRFCTPSSSLHSPTAPSSPTIPRHYTMQNSFNNATVPSSNPRFQSSSLMSLDPVQYPWPSTCGLQLPRQDQDSADYSIPQSLDYGTPSSDMVDYGPNGLTFHHNYNLTYSTFNSGLSCPRSHSNVLSGLGDVSGTADNITESYPPSAYLLEPQKPQDLTELSDQVSSVPIMTMHRECLNSPCLQRVVKNEGFQQYDSQNPDPQTISYSLLPFLKSEEPSMPPNGSRGGEHANEENADMKEQPYAQLIYRALMEAPGHTMILRDIYEWFKEHTDKAADKETKGWQNSIRHNLSMNGAFEKVDQPCEDSKKGFMWRLTDKAIREGVKSTTRYRSKLPNKRGHRSHNPAPQRQASGAKGGHAARKTARLRRSGRLREGRGLGGHRYDQYIARSVPAYNSVPTYDSVFEPPPQADMCFSSYPPSPYSTSEANFSQTNKQDELSAAWSSNPYLLSEGTNTTSPQHTFYPDQAYILPCSPSEPLFYSDSSPADSTSCDEPMTPSDANGDFYVDPNMQVPEDYTLDEMAPNYTH